MKVFELHPILETVNAVRTSRKLAPWKIVEDGTIYSLEVIDSGGEHWRTKPMSNNEIYFYLKGALRMHNDIKLDEQKRNPGVV